MDLVRSEVGVSSDFNIFNIYLHHFLTFTHLEILCFFNQINRKKPQKGGGQEGTRDPQGGEERPRRRTTRRAGAGARSARETARPRLGDKK